MYLGQFTLASDVTLMGRSSQLLSMSTIKLLWQWQWLDDSKKRKLSWLICLSTIVPKLASLLVLTINYFLIKLTGNFWQSSFRTTQPGYIHGNSPVTKNSSGTVSYYRSRERYLPYQRPSKVTFYLVPLQWNRLFYVRNHLLHQKRNKKKQFVTICQQIVTVTNY